MDAFWTSIVSILTAITGVAIVSVLVSRNSDTSNVINAAASGYNSILATAISPVTTAGAGLAITGNSLNLGGNSIGAFR